MKYKRIMICGLLLLSVVGIIFLVYDKNNNSKESKISNIHCSYSINVDNLCELAGDADYVFIGKVMFEKETIYKNPVEKEDEKGNISVITTPYTIYEVENIENIKGNLRIGEVIPIQKAGGYSKDKRELVLYEGDELPIVGENYYFFAYAQPDGSILVSGRNSNIIVNEKDYFDEHDKMIDAASNQIVSNRKRFVSLYEE